MPLQPPPPKPAPPSFQREVVPILRTACLGCHSAQLPTAGFSVDSYMALMKGGKAGVAIVPGKSSESRLVRMLTGAQKPIMPPGAGLKAPDIEIIKRWVDAGAKNDSALTSATTPKTGTKTATANTVTIPKPIGKRLEVPAPINSLAFSPDGKLLAVGTYQRVLLCDPATRTVRTVWSGHLDTVRSLAFSPDGRQLVAGGGMSGALGQVRLWGVAESRELRTFGDHTDIVNGVAFSPDSKTVATASGDRSVKLWDAATGKLSQALRDHADGVLGVAFRADGKLLASCGVDKSVKIWDAVSGKRLYSLGASEETVTDLCFTSAGQVISASTDKLAKLWNIGPEGGGHVRNFGGHGSGVYSVSASSDGQLLATASADKTLRLWNIGSGGNTATFTDAKDWLYAVRISPDKKRLAAGGWDGTLYLWSLDPNKLEGTLFT
ncbi:c-type cytochrome domain-containing protein, partial [Armatimonas sp.]|uniref:c-type cytochrome domain-containing protein n=1 Tax=Armatimonas sp. TaxID=1872638 RepID=UPI00286AA3CD